MLTRYGSTRDDWVSTLAHAGYAARGAIYVIVAFFAVTAAFGGGEAQGSKGALASLMDEPGGQILLGAIGVGLIGYAVWRGIQAALDADNHGTDAKGLTIRAGLLVSALTHVGLAVWVGYALYHGVASGDGSGNGGAQGWTAWLMSKQFGIWLVGAAGVAVIGAGVAQIIKGYKEQFDKYLRIDASNRRWAHPVSRVGLIARGFVFCVMGGFLIVAAWQADPSEARGLGGALMEIRDQPYGPWLLAAVAVGLFAFALYSFLEARYRIVYTPSQVPGAAPAAA